MTRVKAVPEGYHTAAPYLFVRGGTKAIDFYKRAFGAAERFSMPGPGGALLHAELQLGDSVVMLCDEDPQQGTRSPQSIGGASGNVFLYLEDVDAVFKQAIASGATAQLPPTDMFWGDRMAKIQDPFGHGWTLATHKEDVAPEEMEKRAAAAFGK
jgi:PhnB protein